MSKPQRFSRIDAVLQYLHDHLSEQHTVASLAEISCWSRWQFQRVFSDATGLSVAQYIRELRLSMGAEALLDSQAKHIDIALMCGFDSEISFHRAFKQHFQCTPGQYRKQGKRVGIKKPLQIITPDTSEHHPLFQQIRIETRPAFSLTGLKGRILGPFSSAPNFTETVPDLWHQYETVLSENTEPNSAPRIGVIDTRPSPEQEESLCYWAGQSLSSLPACAKLDVLKVPEQVYAVIPIHGSARHIEPAFLWFLRHWLPSSRYRGISGFELEVYPHDYQIDDDKSHMEYWLPIQAREL